MMRKTLFCLSEASCSYAMRPSFFSAGALGGSILSSVNCKKCKMVYGLWGYGLWLRGDGLWVVGEVGEVVSDGVWVGVGASYRKRILQSLQLSDCQT